MKATIEWGRFFCGWHLLLSFFLVLCMCSCRQEVSVEKDFAVSQTLRPSLKNFQEIIKVGHIYATADYMVLHNVYDNATDFFYVYSRPELDFLYSFGHRGNGRNEYMMPVVIENMPGNRFAFRDHATDAYATFLLTDSAAVLSDEVRHPVTDGRFFWEINYVADGQYLLKRSSSSLSARELWDLDDYLLLDELPNTFRLKEELGDAYSTEFDDCWLSVSQNCFATAYFFINRLEFGRVENDSLKLNSFVGVADAPDFHLLGNARSGGKYEYDVEHNMVHYEALTSTSEGVYALYAGVPWGELDKRHSSVIEFYHWDGKPVKRFRLEEPVSDIVVDEARKLIYGINLDLHEDAILVFDYGPS